MAYLEIAQIMKEQATRNDLFSEEAAFAQHP